MRCLVTGATGFVGSHLVERLAREGHEVLALARPTSNRSHLESLGVRIVNGTIDSINVFAYYAEELDVVFHLAAVTKPLREDDFRRVNTVGTERLLRGLRRGEFRGRVVLLSSLAAGGPAAGPQEPRREADKDAPVSKYGKSKLAAEKAVKEGAPQGSTWSILRPGAIYGPREHEILEVLRMIHRQGLAVQFGPPVVLQMTHVADVVDGLVRAAFVPEARSQTYYLADRCAWSFEEIVTLAAEALGRRVRILRLPMRAGWALARCLDTGSRLAKRSLAPLGCDKLREMEARYWLADPAKLESELGWRARVPFPEGLRENVEWYQQEGWL